MSTTNLLSTRRAQSGLRASSPRCGSRHGAIPGMRCTNTCSSSRRKRIGRRRNYGSNSTTRRRSGTSRVRGVGGRRSIPQLRGEDGNEGGHRAARAAQRGERRGGKQHHAVPDGVAEGVAPVERAALTPRAVGDHREHALGCVVDRRRPEVDGAAAPPGLRRARVRLQLRQQVLLRRHHPSLRAAVRLSDCLLVEQRDVVGEARA